VSKQGVNASGEKAFCFDYLQRNAEAIASLNDSIFYFAELGMQEIRTAGLMCELLEKAGFKVERGISGFPSGFCATCGCAAPRQLQSTPSMMRTPTTRRFQGPQNSARSSKGAPGHCEGHNVNAAMLVASALAAKAAIDTFGLTGTLKVFGAPAEEEWYAHHSSIGFDSDGGRSRCS
jgi:aminobenzoyl-glutamate utilization protein B